MQASTTMLDSSNHSSSQTPLVMNLPMSTNVCAITLGTTKDADASVSSTNAVNADILWQRLCVFAPHDLCATIHRNLFFLDPNDNCMILWHAALEGNS